MIEQLFSSFLILLTMIAGIFLGVNPSEQQSKASISTGRSNVSAICRAQALCLIESSMENCVDFENLQMPNPGEFDSSWVYSFADPITENGMVIGEANLSGTNFTLTCQNVESETRGQVICSDDGGSSTSTCESMGLSRDF